MNTMILASYGGIQTGLLLMVVGMGVVFGALLVLMAVVALMGRLLADQPTPAPATAPAPQPAKPASDQLADARLIAVLTAAATAALGRRAAIHGVRLVTRRDRAWAQQGRRSIMTSHRPHR